VGYGSAHTLTNEEENGVWGEDVRVHGAREVGAGRSGAGTTAAQRALHARLRASLRGVFMCVCACLSVCLCVPVCLSVGLSIYLSILLYARLGVSLDDLGSSHLSVSLLISPCLSVLKSFSSFAVCRPFPASLSSSLPFFSLSVPTFIILSVVSLSRISILSLSLPLFFCQRLATSFCA